MTSVLILLLLAGLLALGFAYGRRRQPYPGKGFFGSSNATDRDLTRVREELTALAGRDDDAATLARYVGRHDRYPRQRAA
jgi:hypothetical protein